MSVIKGRNVVIKDNVILGDNVILEDDVYLDYGVIIRDNVHIKKGTTVGARCILGEYLADFYKSRNNGNHPLIIGENSIIRSDTIIYGDTNIGDNFQTGHKVTIREKSNIGNNVRIGTLSDIQGECEIGNYVSIHSQCFIAPNAKIEDFVWLFPRVVLTNDPTPPSFEVIGVKISEFAVVCAGALILPGIEINKEALIGAGAVVTKNVAEGAVIVGNPGKVVGHISEIKNKVTGKNSYPWRYNFDRGMPWENTSYDEWIRNK
ncbi:MAG: N-acetyltransferase [Clostridium sp.]